MRYNLSASDSAESSVTRRRGPGQVGSSDEPQRAVSGTGLGRGGVAVPEATCWECWLLLFLPRFGVAGVVCASSKAVITLAGVGRGRPVPSRCCGPIRGWLWFGHGRRQGGSPGRWCWWRV